MHRLSLQAGKEREDSRDNDVVLWGALRDSTETLINCTTDTILVTSALRRRSYLLTDAGTVCTSPFFLRIVEVVRGVTCIVMADARG